MYVCMCTYIRIYVCAYVCVCAYTFVRCVRVYPHTHMKQHVIIVLLVANYMFARTYTPVHGCFKMDD